MPGFLILSRRDLREVMRFADYVEAVAEAFSCSSRVVASHPSRHSDWLTEKASKYMWLSALDHSPTRPDTGACSVCWR